MEQHLLSLLLLWPLLCVQSLGFPIDIQSLRFPFQRVKNAKEPRIPVLPTVIYHFSMHRTNTLEEQDEETVKKYVGLLQQMIESIPIKRATLILHSDLTLPEKTAPENHQSESSVTMIVGSAQSKAEKPLASVTLPVENAIATGGKSKTLGRLTSRAMPNLVESPTKDMKPHGLLETSADKRPQQGKRTHESPDRVQVFELPIVPLQTLLKRKEKLPEEEVKTLRKIVGLLRGIVENNPTKHPHS